MEIKKIIQYPNLSYKERIKQIEQNTHKFRQTELEQAFLSPDYWQILNKVENRKNIGYIKLKSGKEIPVNIDIRKEMSDGLEPKIIYTFKDNGKEVGYIELFERENGVHLFKVENLDQNKYRGINKLADRIGVENCLKRGLTDFEITGDAILNSHAVHYLSGKRFYPVDKSRAKIFKQKYGTENPNTIVKSIINNTPKGQKFYTQNLKTLAFYLPNDLIENYINLAKLKPILR